MKPLALLLLLLSSAGAVSTRAQGVAAGAEDPPGVVVLKFSWSKERLNWERDPFGGPLENFDEMRARARNERRIAEAKRAGSNGEVDRLTREANADAANMAKSHQQKGPARYVFMYKVSVRNNGAKAIRALDWDYVFFDSETQAETGRRQFASEERIGAGKSRELSFTIASPPTQTISANALDNKERQNLGERIVIVRIEYEDGTVWRKP